MNLETIKHNPDVLSCLANLSNDEVFTSPKLANEILDLLPKELWSNPEAKFLDPASKTGIFLREIIKRLLKGLEQVYPDLQERINHICNNQVYGIAITELTSLLSRRSVYCSKMANGNYSVCTNFDSEEGNIFYNKIEHTWKNDSCIYCGASTKGYDRSEELEAYAYEFIHDIKEEELINMKWDVIISNPPYQISDNGAGASAKPLYHKFIEQAKKLNPRYLTMIIPARWFTGGKGLDNFRNEMLNDEHIKELIDYPDSSDCFPGVSIKGGVCYFLYDSLHDGDCKVTTIKGNKKSTLIRPLLEEDADTFIRYNEAVSIYNKVKEYNEKSFSEMVSSRKPFGFGTKYKGEDKTKRILEPVDIYGTKCVGITDKSMIRKNIELVCVCQSEFEPRAHLKVSHLVLA